VTVTNVTKIIITKSGRIVTKAQLKSSLSCW